MGMAALWDDLNLEQGATRRFRVQYAHRDAEGNPVPYDLTGCTARMQLRPRYGGVVLVELTTTPTEQGSIELQPNGWIAVWISDEATDGLVREDGKPYRSVVWDLEVEWPSGDVSRVLQGTAAVDANITRDVVL